MKVTPNDVSDFYNRFKSIEIRAQKYSNTLPLDLKTIPVIVAADNVFISSSAFPLSFDKATPKIL